MLSFCIGVSENLRLVFGSDVQVQNADYHRKEKMLSTLNYYSLQKLSLYLSTECLSCICAATTCNK